MIADKPEDQCQLYEMSQGGFQCLNCGFRYTRDVWAKCQGSELVVRAQQPDATIEDRVRAFCERANAVSTAYEAIALLEQCRKCDTFGDDFCKTDKGCDKRAMLVLRLTKRNCDKWE
jgi:hypothetical protein